MGLGNYCIKYRLQIFKLIFADLGNWHGNGLVLAVLTYSKCVAFEITWARASLTES